MCYMHSGKRYVTERMQVLSYEGKRVMYSIMIVDDEKAIRESLPWAVDFEQYGFKVCATAKNGQDALEKMEIYSPEVVLLDVCMPILDGVGVLQKLHETGDKKLPYIVMLSGYSDFEYVRAAMRYGVKDYLTKPMDENELIQILTQLKEELDARLQKQDCEKILQAARALQKMYHDGDGERDAYQEYVMMHCVVLNSDSAKEAYSAIWSCIEEMVPGDKIAFFRNKGSVLSYLVSSRIIEEYQYSVPLFARHILHHIKKCGVECALLFDESLFVEKIGTFRNDYATHLYQMLTEVFWGDAQVIQNQKGHLNEVNERRIEQEDVFLAGLKKAVRELDETALKEVYDAIIGETYRARLNITFVQEINYRIYYALMDLILEEGDTVAEPVLKPLDWRDTFCFIRYAQWKEMLWEQISTVFSYVDNINKMKHQGMADKAITYIRNHFREQLTLKEVADECYISAAYLGRCVQKAAGVSFKQYLNDLRLEEAKRLLRQTDKMIYEIAEEVGFKESKYFVSKFTAEIGKTPLEYRRMVKEER